jgi:hypothetical protein
MQRWEGPYLSSLASHLEWSTSLAFSSPHSFNVKLSTFLKPCVSRLLEALCYSSLGILVSSGDGESRKWDEGKILGHRRVLKNPWVGQEDVFLVHPQNGLNGFILNWCTGGCWFTPAPLSRVRTENGAGIQDGMQIPRTTPIQGPYPVLRSGRNLNGCDFVEKERTLFRECPISYYFYFLYLGLWYLAGWNVLENLK